MAKSKEDKLVAKRRVLAERTAMVLGVSEAEAIVLLSVPRQQSLRINPLKANGQTMDKLKALGWEGEGIEWCPDGYSIDAGLAEIRDSDLVTNGEVYIQNAASWLPVLALNPQAGDEVLDICAAPGGKTSHLAAISDNKATITANDNSRPRLAKLRANLSRMGVEDVECTLIDASQLARRLDGRQFDKILLDAPCSGEGMMQFGRDKDFDTWSVAQIKRLQQLQRRIITQAWQLLRPGGTLVYSTCTMAPEEDEAVVDYLLLKTDDSQVQSFEISLPNRVAPILEWNGKSFHPAVASSVRLKPSVAIEAFYVCRLIKL